MTSVPVLLALDGAPHESALLAGLSRPGSGVQIVRRCVDLADLLASAGAGTSAVAVVAARLRRLDHEAVAALRASGVAVIAVVSSEDEAGERRIRMLGVDDVVVVSEPDSAAQSVLSVLSALQRPRPGGRPASHRVPPQGAPEPDVVDGRLVAVWGPAGAPGRTTVATYLACELAELGVSTLLADVDTYGGAVAQLLGLLDESPGIAAACRAVSAGALDVAVLAQVAREVGPGLRVLTGIVRSDRWPELRASNLAVVWSRARGLAAWTVADCGFCLEQDEELSYDTSAPRRNAAARVTLAESDVLLAVGRADPVGMQRLVRALPEARAAAPQAELHVVLTRVRKGPVGRDTEQQLLELLLRHTGVSEAVLVREDQVGYDAALMSGRALHEVAPRSPARSALADLARRIGDVPPVGALSRWVWPSGRDRGSRAVTGV